MVYSVCVLINIRCGHPCEVREREVTHTFCNLDADDSFHGSSSALHVGFACAIESMRTLLQYELAPSFGSRAADL